MAFLIGIVAVKSFLYCIGAQPVSTVTSTSNITGFNKTSGPLETYNAVSYPYSLGQPSTTISFLKTSSTLPLGSVVTVEPTHATAVQSTYSGENSGLAIRGNSCYGYIVAVTVPLVLSLLILLATNAYLLYHTRLLLTKGKSYSFLSKFWQKECQGSSLALRNSTSLCGIAVHPASPPPVLVKRDTEVRSTDDSLQMTDLVQKKHSLHSSKRAISCIYDDVRVRSEAAGNGCAELTELSVYDNVCDSPTVIINRNVLCNEEGSGYFLLSTNRKLNDTQLYQQLNPGTIWGKALLKPKPKPRLKQDVETSSPIVQHRAQPKPKAPFTLKVVTHDNACDYENIAVV